MEQQSPSLGGRTLLMKKICSPHAILFIVVLTAVNLQSKCYFSSSPNPDSDFGDSPTSSLETLSQTTQMQQKEKDLLKQDFNYSWIGHRFFPPGDVPTYNPEDYLSIFQRISVLWMGDSTLRRPYLTLQILLNQTKTARSIEEQLQQQPGNSSNTGVDLKLGLIEGGTKLNINMGEGMPQEHCPYIHSRYGWDPKTHIGGKMFDGTSKTTSLLCRGTPNSTKRNDFAYHPCFKSMAWFSKKRSSGL